MGENFVTTSMIKHAAGYMGAAHGSLYMEGTPAVSSNGNIIGTIFRDLTRKQEKLFRLTATRRDLKAMKCDEWQTDGRVYQVRRAVRPSIYAAK